MKSEEKLYCKIYYELDKKNIFNNILNEIYNNLNKKNKIKELKPKELKPKKLKFKVLKNDEININDIDKFESTSKKCDNDKWNKKRELIIIDIINNKIPLNYYEENNKWNNLKKEIEIFLQKLTNNDNYNLLDYKTICIKKGGRNYNYDFEISCYNNEQRKKLYKVEFKYNISPQFLSLTKPNNYLTNSENIDFVEYFYDNYLSKLDFDNKPSKKEYIEDVYKNSPKGDKMKRFKDMYKNNIDFNKKCNEDSKKCIIEYIKKSELKSDKLFEKINNTQENKIYMIYKDNKFNIEENKLFKKINSIIIDKNRYIINIDDVDNNKIKITCLLRWKNGVGILPAFQLNKIKSNI